MAVINGSPKKLCRLDLKMEPIELTQGTVDAASVAKNSCLLRLPRPPIGENPDSPNARGTYNGR